MSGVKFTQGLVGPYKPEPFMQAMLIPGCRGCGAPHPMRDFPDRLDEVKECPNCGTALEGSTKVRYVSAAGHFGWLVDWLFGIGIWCMKQARKL